MNEKITNEHVTAYSNIDKKTKKQKGKYIEQLMIDLELIDENKLYFSIKKMVSSFKKKFQL